MTVLPANDDEPKEAPDPSRPLLARLEAAGATVVSPPVLQPAAPFLELSGEELAKRIYLTSGPDGAELCLRPEFTIPLSRHYLANETVGARAMYAYEGTVFRDRGVVGEFPQAGIELFGEADREHADASLIQLAVTSAGLETPQLRLGDVGLFETFLTAIGFPPAVEAHWRRRFSRAADLAAEIAAMRERPADATPLSRWLATVDEPTARAAVEEMLRLAGTPVTGQVAGRSSADIAARYVERALLEAAALEGTKADLLMRYLRVDASPWEALDELEAITREGKLEMNGTLDDFARRLGLLADEGVDLYDSARFSTAFGRRIDYYSGIVFEVHDPQGEGVGPLVGGGRYDGLLKRLGAGEDVPAVGFSVWVERLPGAPA
ncbi:MAG: ATP phosphoribosyltransferase regulatory subunit [Pseudomonadota bacterium]